MFGIVDNLWEQHPRIGATVGEPLYERVNLRFVINLPGTILVPYNILPSSNLIRSTSQNLQVRKALSFKGLHPTEYISHAHLLPDASQHRSRSQRTTGEHNQLKEQAPLVFAERLQAQVQDWEQR